MSCQLPLLCLFLKNGPSGSIEVSKCHLEAGNSLAGTIECILIHPSACADQHDFGKLQIGGTEEGIIVKALSTKLTRALVMAIDDDMQPQKVLLEYRVVSLMTVELCNRFSNGFQVVAAVFDIAGNNKTIHEIEQLVVERNWVKTTQQSKSLLIGGRLQSSRPRSRTRCPVYEFVNRFGGARYTGVAADTPQNAQLRSSLV